MFRNAQQTLDVGNDSVKRGNFSDAVDKYYAAARKFEREGDRYSSQVASCLALIMSLHAQESTETYDRIVESLRALGNITLKIGIYELPSETIKNECILQSAEIRTWNLPENTPVQKTFKAKELMKLGMQYQNSVGENTIFLTEIFKKSHQKGTDRARYLFGASEILEGDALSSDDPKQAAGHYQNAYNHFMLIGNQQFAETIRTKASKSSKAARCWFCGREVTGEDINFVVLPTSIPHSISRNEKSILPTHNPSSNVVYACIPCYNAVSGVADKLASIRAQEVYRKVEGEMAAMRREVEELRSIVWSLVSSHRR
jgi:hypothetical protein